MNADIEIPGIHAEWENVNDLFVLDFQIGQGTYGKVFRAEPKKQDESQEGKRFREPIYAIKCVKVEDPTFQREVSLLQALKHENVICLKGIFMEHRTGWLVLEYAEFHLYSMVSFSRRCRDRGQAVPDVPGMRKSIMFQLLQGLCYLHYKQVIHQDLKPGNILVMGDGSSSTRGRVKIADFGDSRHCDSVPVPRGGDIIGTLWYRSPELLLETELYSHSIDLWALGCIFAELFVLRPLFVTTSPDTEGSYNYDQLKSLHRLFGDSGGWLELMKMPKFAQFAEEYAKDLNSPKLTTFKELLRENFVRNFPLASDSEKLEQELAIDLIVRLLHPNPGRRISCPDALKHQFFRTGSAPTDDVFNNKPIPFPSRKPRVTQNRQCVSDPSKQGIAQNVSNVAQAQKQDMVQESSENQRSAAQLNVSSDNGCFQQIGNVKPRSGCSQYMPIGSLMPRGSSAAPPVHQVKVSPLGFAIQRPPGVGAQQSAPYGPVHKPAPLTYRMSSLTLHPQQDSSAIGPSKFGRQKPPGGFRSLVPARLMPSNVSSKAGSNIRQQKALQPQDLSMPQQLQVVQSQKVMPKHPPQAKASGFLRPNPNVVQQSRVMPQYRSGQQAMALPHVNSPLGTIPPNTNVIQQPMFMQNAPPGQGTMNPHESHP